MRGRSVSTIGLTYRAPLPDMLSLNHWSFYNIIVNGQRYGVARRQAVVEKLRILQRGRPCIASLRRLPEHHLRVSPQASHSFPRDEGTQDFASKSTGTREHSPVGLAGLQAI